MSNKEGGDAAASSLAKKRWGKATPKKRSEHARKMAKARWDAYYAAHPEKKRTRK
jgi:hypothetical protein